MEDRKALTKIVVVYKQLSHACMHAGFHVHLLHVMPSGLFVTRLCGVCILLQICTKQFSFRSGSKNRAIAAPEDLTSGFAEEAAVIYLL